MAGPVDKDQVDIATKLAALMDRMAVSSAKIDAAYATQVESMKQLATTMGQVDVKNVIGEIGKINKDLKQMAESLSKAKNVNQQTFEEMAKKAGDAGTSVTSLSGRIKESTKLIEGMNKTPLDKLHEALSEPGGAAGILNKQLGKLGITVSKKFPDGMMIASAAASGFAQGIENVIAVGKASLGMLEGLTSALFNIGGAILAIPFKMFKGLIDIANNAGAGSTELAQAIENLRKEFGALGTGSPKVIMDMSVQLKGFSDTGLSAYRIFGNLAHRLEEFLKLAQEMGPNFQNFADEFKENGGALLAWQKGLGLSGEMMRTMSERAKSLGTNMAKQLYEVQKQAQGLGKAFQIDSKLISRDMAKAFADVKHFAGATVKEIATASVYARKLGLELDKITGTLDAFDTFDSAAESAAKLSQSFGLNVDAFKLMEAQDPATQIDMLRKQFAAAGQDASSFNRQQMKLLASTTGLDEATARQVFSLKNQGASLDDIKKKSEGAEKKQMSQAEAMKALADSIERLVQAGGQGSGGYFERFFRGFLGGIQASKEFRDTIMNIRRGLQLVEMAGVKAGKLFAQLTPIEEFLGGLAEFFKPGKFSKLFNAFGEEIVAFFEDATHGEHSFPKLMENIQKHFFDFFNDQTPAGQKTIKGFRKIFKIIINVIADGIRWASTKIAEVLKSITKLILDPKSAKDAVKEAGGDGAAAAFEMIQPLIDSLRDSWNILKPAIFDLVKVVGEKLFEYFTSDDFINLVKPALPYVFGILFGPVIVRSLLGIMTSSVGSLIANAIKGAFLGPAAGAAERAGTRGFGGLFRKIFGGLGKFLGPAAIAVAIGDLAVNVNDAMKKFEDKLAPTFGRTEAKMGAAAAGIINAFTFGLLPDSIQEIVAEQFASMSEMIFGAIQDVFGASFTGRLKAYIGSALDVFGSFGNLISEIFKGKEGDISGALQDLGGKLLSFVGNWFLWMVEQIPTLYVMAFQFGTKLLSMFWGVLADLFKKGEDIPIVGPVFSLISKYFQTLSDMMDKISDLLGGISDYFKANGVVGTIEKVLEFFAPLEPVLMTVGKALMYVVGFLTAPLWVPILGIIKLLNKGISFFGPTVKKMLTVVWTQFNATFDTIMWLIEGTFNFIVGVWEAISPWFSKNVFEPLSRVFIKIEENITDSFSATWSLVKEVWNIASSWFNSYVIEPIKSVFGPVSGTIGDIFRKAWDLIVDVFNMTQIGQLFGAVVDGITLALNKLLDIGVFKDLIAIAKKAFKISSPSKPSKVFEDIGDDIVAGFDKGIDGLPTSVSNKMSEAAAIAEKKSKTVAETVATNVKQAKAAQPAHQATKVAIPDTSKVSAGVADASKQVQDATTKVEQIKAPINSLTSTVEVGVVGKMNSAVHTLAAAQGRFMESVGSQLTDIGLTTSDASAKIAASSSEIMNGGIKQALLAISNLVEKANSLNDAMGSLPDLKLNAKLKTLASGLGIGGKFNYQVKSKDVIINVNLQVEMNAADLEKSLVLREKSVIRNRLNFATGPGTAGKESTDVLPNSPSGVYAFPATAKLVKPRWHENIL